MRYQICDILFNHNIASNLIACSIRSIIYTDKNDNLAESYLFVSENKNLICYLA